jgi:3-oxoacyl-[acyl-carrier-protein] synthase-1
MTKNPAFYLSHMGIACSLGCGQKEVAKNLFAPTRLPFSETRTLSSGQKVPVGAYSTVMSVELSELSPEMAHFNSRNNRLLKLVLDEIGDAIKEAKVKYGPKRIALVLATSTSGMLEGEKAFGEKIKTGHWPTSFDYRQQEAAGPSLFATQYLGIEGPSYTVSTACSAGSKALLSAKRLLEADLCDAVICGGVDTLCDLTLNGFDSLELISQTPCKPFDHHRDGITIGEGAAVFLLSKELFSLSDYDENPVILLGGGESSDAYHISSPDPQGIGAEKAITQALQEAKLTPKDIAYINLHGTGTPLNDAMESMCINRLFGPLTPCSSTKALTGHTLGASGAIEAGFLWLCLTQMNHGRLPLPPHHGIETPDPDLDEIHFVTPKEKVNLPVTCRGQVALMSNSFAFGGSNVSLILGTVSLKESK